MERTDKDGARITGAQAMAVALSVAMWGASFPLLKCAVDFIPPMTLGWVRFVPGASVGLAVLLLAPNRREVLHTLRRRWYVIAGLALFLVVIPSVMQNIGMRHTTASLASLIQASSPAFTVALAPFILREGLTLRKVAGLLVALGASVGLVLCGSRDLGAGSLLGNLLMMGTALSYGFAPIFSKLALRSFQPFHAIGLGFGLGLVVMAGISFAAREPYSWTGTMPLAGWLSLAGLAFLPGLLAQYLWYSVLRRQEASRLIIVVYLIPVVSILISHVWLGETVSLLAVALGGVVLGGVTLAQLEKPRSKRGLGVESLHTPQNPAHSEAPGP